MLKRHIMWQKRLITELKRPAKSGMVAACIASKSGLCVVQKRPITQTKRPITEQKRPVTEQKRPAVSPPAARCPPNSGVTTACVCVWRERGREREGERERATCV